MASAVTLEPALAAQVRDSADHFIVTGATGWFGQIVCEALSNALGAGQLHRLHGFASRTGAVELRNGLRVPTQPLAELATLPRQHRYWLLHFAFLTKDKQDALPLADYAARNRAMRTQVEAALVALDVAGMCITSSGAVYKSTHGLHRDLSAYPYAALKVEDEEIFARACSDRQVPLIIPRIFNMSGPYINKWNAYALSSLLVMALSGEPLVIKATHPVIRSYCYAGDIANVMLGWLFNAAPGEPLTLDACLPDAIEIGELARHICTLTGSDEANIIREFQPALPTDRYMGDSATFTALCKSYGIMPMPLKTQIRITMEDIQKKRV